MQTVNFFDAFLVDRSDKSIQFTLVVPTDDPGPWQLDRVVKLIIQNKVYFCGGEGELDSDYFDQGVEDDE